MNISDIKNFIEEKLKALCEQYYPDYRVNVYDEINYQDLANDDIDDNTIIVMFKSLAGTINNKTASIPAQLSIFSEQNSLRVTKDLFNKFANLYSNKEETIGLNRIKQYYTTPVDIQNFLEVNNGYRSMIYVGADFILIENISGLKEVKIDNELIEFETYSLNYVANQSSSQSFNEKILRSKNQTPSLTLQLTIYPTNSIFNQKLRGIRTEQLNSNYPFSMQLIFQDGGVEEYKMISINHIMSGGKKQLDLLNINFTLTRF